MWKVSETNDLPGGETQLRLTLRPESEIKTLWKYSFLAEMMLLLELH